jgi:hypothetical protein
MERPFFCLFIGIKARAVDRAQDLLLHAALFISYLLYGATDVPCRNIDT